MCIDSVIYLIRRIGREEPRNLDTQTCLFDLALCPDGVACFSINPIYYECVYTVVCVVCIYVAAVFGILGCHISIAAAIN